MKYQTNWVLHTKYKYTPSKHPVPSEPVIFSHRIAAKTDFISFCAEGKWQNSNKEPT